MPVLKFVFAGLVFIHGWYDRQCCGDSDCHPVPCERITAVNGGFEFRSYDRAIYFFARDKMKPSQDGDCHVCLHRTELHLPAAPVCLYLPVSS